MPGERRILRSNKENPPRTTSSKGKTAPNKKGGVNGSANEEVNDKPQPNGAEPVKNGVNGTDDVEMGDDESEQVRIGNTKDGDEEMTVVVPPPKSSKLNGKTGYVKSKTRSQAACLRESTDRIANIKQRRLGGRHRYGDLGRSP